MYRGRSGSQKWDIFLTLLSEIYALLSYFNANRRFTKSRFAFDTSPSIRNLRFRFVDFLVRMCRLKDFWCVIFPVPVTLNLFLALEFVLTFGISKCFSVQPLRRSALAETWGAFLEQFLLFYGRGAKIKAYSRFNV